MSFIFSRTPSPALPDPELLFPQQRLDLSPLSLQPGRLRRRGTAGRGHNNSFNVEKTAHRSSAETPQIIIIISQEAGRTDGDDDFLTQTRRRV